MKIERRNFFRIGAAGMTGTLVGLQSAFSQEASKPTDVDKQQNPASGTVAEFKGGTGSLHLVLSFDRGTPRRTLDVQVENFNRGRDKSMIMDGTFRSKERTAKVYRSYFCVDNANQVFARLGDEHNWTSVVLSNSEDPNIESLTIWNDAKGPQAFRIDKKRFREVANTRGGPPPSNYIVGGNASSLDLKGARTPPDVTVEELENALDNNPDYLAFVRGKTRMRLHASPIEFACFYIVKAVPGGSLFIVDWEA